MVSNINKGDKLMVTKRMSEFLNEGDIVKVIDVSESGMVSFMFGENYENKGIVNSTVCENCFEKIKEIEEKATPSITSKIVEEIIKKSDITVQTVFDKCTVVACKLPNGFVIVESYTCVSPENYSEEVGIDICLEKITNKIWELEGYRLQEELYRENMEVEEYSCDTCDEYNCPCDCPCDDCDECNDNYDFDEFDDDYDECLDTDLDCDDCDDYDCPFNSNNR